jgi:hypothetical protein
VEKALEEESSHPLPVVIELSMSTVNGCKDWHFHSSLAEKSTTELVYKLSHIRGFKVRCYILEIGPDAYHKGA